MRLNTKTIRCLAVLGLFFRLHSAHAQPAGWESTMKRISTQQSQQFGSRLMFHNLNGSFRNNQEPLEDIKHHLFLVLKDSSSVEVHSRIYSDSVRHANYLVFENRSLPKSDPNRTIRIFPAETLGISFKNKGNLQPGQITDSCWLFPVESGTINLYSFLPQVNPADYSYFTALQYGDGPLEPFTIRRLQELLKGHEKALKAFWKQQYFLAVRTFNKN